MPQKKCYSHVFQSIKSGSNMTPSKRRFLAPKTHRSLSSSSKLGHNFDSPFRAKRIPREASSNMGSYHRTSYCVTSQTNKQMTASFWASNKLGSIGRRRGSRATHMQQAASTKQAKKLQVLRTSFSENTSWRTDVPNFRSSEYFFGSYYQQLSDFHSSLDIVSTLDNSSTSSITNHSSPSPEYSTVS